MHLTRKQLEAGLRRWPEWSGGSEDRRHQCIERITLMYHDMRTLEEPPVVDDAMVARADKVYRETYQSSGWPLAMREALVAALNLQPPIVSGAQNQATQAEAMQVKPGAERVQGRRTDEALQRLIDTVQPHEMFKVSGEELDRIGELTRLKKALRPQYVCNDCNSGNIRKEAYVPVSNAMIDAGNNVVMHGEGRRAYLATIFRVMYAQMLKEQLAPQSALHTDLGGWHQRIGDDWLYKHSRTKPRNNFSPSTHRRKTDAPGNSCFHSRSGDKR